MSVDPRGMSVTQWADAVLFTMSDGWSYGRLDNPDKWQDWAMGLIRASPFTQQNPPDPFGFKDWREFAMRLYPYLEKVSGT